MERILCIDFGMRRIGLAISDELNLTAQGLGIIECRNKREDIKRIKEIVKEKKITRFLVGLPLNKYGNVNKDSPIFNFIKDLKKNLKLPIETWDERLTTLQAKRVLLSADVSRKRRKKIVDKISAQIILQSYLDYINQKSNIKIN